MIESEIKIKYSRFKSETELTAHTFRLFEEAKQALNTAYSPYSNFQVGAALRLSNGEIIRGSNQENAAYPSGLCAERTAIFYAGSQFPKETIEEIFVLARKTGDQILVPACPCGGCRQVLLEYETKQNTPIIVGFKIENEGYIQLASVSDLLPFKFDSSSL